MIADLGICVGTTQEWMCVKVALQAARHISYPDEF